MMYDAYQGMADVGDRVRQLAESAHAILTAWSAHPYAPPWRRMSAYYELVALAGFTHARPDYGIDSVEIDGEAVPVEERGRLVDAVLPTAPFPQGGRRGRSQGAARRADVRPLRHPIARHDPHAAPRPPGVRHRLDQPAQRQARGRRISRSRTIPSTSSISCVSSASPAISSPFASRPSRRSRRPRSWRGTATASSRRASR